MSDDNSTRLGRLKRRAHNNPVVVAIIVIAAVLGCVAGLKSSFSTLFGGAPSAPAEQELLEPRDEQGPPPTMSNAFKAGYSLSQLPDAHVSGLEFTKWAHRAEAHLEGLGLDSERLREIADAGTLSSTGYNVLIDQLRTRIEAIHGGAVASTFVVGSELLRVTDALISHASDPEYRATLAAKGVGIGESVRTFNLHVQNAYLPKQVGGDWQPQLKSALNRSGDSRFGVEFAQWYRDSIVAYYYEWQTQPGPFVFRTDSAPPN